MIACHRVPLNKLFGAQNPQVTLYTKWKYINPLKIHYSRKSQLVA